MANKPLKTLTLPSLEGSVTYDLHPEWDNVENKPDIIGQFHKLDDATIQGEIFNDYENNIASGAMSHAEGSHTIAASDNQHVQGKYNIEDAENTYAHIIGNGDKIARSNAHTLDWSGNAWYAGTMTAQAIIIGAMSYGNILPETGVEGQLFFLIGGGNNDSDNEIEATENDGIITLSNLTAVENDGIVTISDLLNNKVTVTENDGIVIISSSTSNDIEAVENNGILTISNSEITENNGIITIDSTGGDIKATESNGIITISD